MRADVVSVAVDPERRLRPVPGWTIGAGRRALLSQKLNSNERDQKHSIGHSTMVSRRLSAALIPHPITMSNGDQLNLIVYGTGFRGAGADISVTIGSENAQVLYAGPQGDAPGVDQFNILMPADLATGGPQRVSIVLTAAGHTANTVNMTIQ